MEDWKSRAIKVPATESAPVSDWKSRATPIKAEANKEEPSRVEEQLIKEKPSGEVSSEEIKRIAENFNLSPEETKTLEEIKEYYGSIPETLDPTSLDSWTNTGKAFAGTLGRGFGLNLPQYFYKKSQENPKMREAIDALQEVGTSRQGLLLKGTELAAGIGGALGLAKGASNLSKVGEIGAKAAKLYTPASVVTGAAAQGLGTSKEGEELKEVATGAALGAGLLGAGKLASGIYKGVKGVKDSILETAVKRLEENAPKIEQELDRIIEQTPKLDNKIKVLVDNSESLKDFSSFTKANIPAEKLIDQSDIKIFKEDSDKVAALAESLGVDIGKITDKQISQSILYSDLTNLKKVAEKFHGKSQSLEEVIKESPEFANKVIKNGYKLSKVPEVVANLGVRRQLSKVNPLQKAAIFISDGKQVAKVFDDRLGLFGKMSIERALDEGAIKLNLYTDQIRKPLKDTYKLAKEIRTSGTSMEDLYNKLDKGEATEGVALKFKTLFEELRNKAKEAGINVEKREGYVPHLRKTFTDYRTALNNELKETVTELGKPINNLTDSEFSSILKENTRFKDIFNEIQQLSGEKLKNKDDFLFYLNKFKTRPDEMKNGLTSVASATKSRTGKDIPNWALEKDVPTLAARWIQGTFKHAAVRDTVQKLKSAAEVADKVGDNYTAKYLRNLTSDLLGKRRGTLASWGGDIKDSFIIKMTEKADNTTNPITKRIYKGASDLPDFLLATQNQVYANYLGFNPKSAIQNIASAYLQNMPEIGAGLGTKLYLESVRDIAALKRKGVNLGEMVTEAGIIPRQWDGEMIAAVRNGIKSSKIGDISRKTLDKYTDLAMSLFSKSETIARAQTLLMANRLGKEVLDNPKVADSILSNISSSTYRRGIKEAIKAKDLDTVQKELNQYMQSTNMFNYDRLNMSEYGRVMGPMFSIFSKWPTATAGKLLHTYMREGKKGGTTKLAATLILPFASLKIADQMLLDDQSDINKKMIGTKGLSGWTQFDSIPTDVGLREGLTATPIISAATDFADSLTKDKGIRKWINSTVRTFGPGAGLIRFLGEDIPLYITGEKQERVNLLPE